MENKNIRTNLLIKQMIQSDAIAYDDSYVGSPVDTEFGVLNAAYQETGREYAKLKMAIQQNKCMDQYCTLETARITQMEAAPKLSLDFLANVMGELAVTETPYYDVENEACFMIANCILTKKPGFSKTDGYQVYLDLLQNGSQQIAFIGPAFQPPLIINSSALSSLLDSDTSLVASTPNVGANMLLLLPETGLFLQEMMIDSLG